MRSSIRVAYKPLYALTLTTALSALLTGCSLQTTAPSLPDLPNNLPGTAISGVVHGGQQPISGAKVYLLAVNPSGYGGNGIAASSSNASISLLNSSVTSQTGAGQDSIGYYVLTNATGGFSLSGDYNCSTGYAQGTYTTTTPYSANQTAGSEQVYLYALGGTPISTSSTANTSIGMIAALGPCNSPTTQITLNEISTIGTAYAFAGFASDATHIGSSGSALAITGLSNAYGNVSNLVSISGGTAATSTAGGNGTVPTSTIISLADILATCINTSGTISGPTNATNCYTLLNNAQSAGTSGTLPGDTATAAINIAHNPGSAISALFGLIPGTGAPFVGGLSSKPNDFTVSISFNDGGTDPAMVAIDASGNAWVVNFSGPNTLSELSPLGVVAAGAPFTGNGLPTSGFSPQGMAVDPYGNVWIDNGRDNSLSEFTSSGAAAANSPFTYSCSAAVTAGPMAIDANGNIWIPGFTDHPCAHGLNGLSEFSNSGAVLSPAYDSTTGATGYYMGSFVVAEEAGVAIDKGANNVFSGAAHTGSSAYVEVLDFSTSADTFGTPGTGGGLSSVQEVAYDSFGSVWIADTGGLARFTAGSNPSPVYSSEVTVSSFQPYSVAVDGSGTLWIGGLANASGSGYSAFEEFATPGVTTNSPTMMSPTHGFFANGETLSDQTSYGLAVDGSGDVWYGGCNTNCGSGFSTRVVEFIGIATPVITPLSAATASGSTGPGTRP
jgi:hypothetical protein